MRVTLPTTVVLAVAHLAACDGELTPVSANTMRDSAGVSIVESALAAWGDRDVWEAAETPRVNIGHTGGDPAYELYRPRAAFRLSDGRIAIGNSGSLQVRYYDSSGKHLMDVGRRGGGPGEFNRLDRVFRLAGDSVVVYDQPLRRITVFDPSGAYVRGISIAQPHRNFFPVISGRLPDGTYVGSMRLRRQNDELPNGLIRDTLLILAFGAAGELLDTIGAFHNRVMDVQTRSIGERSIRGPAEVAFSPRTVWTVGRGRLLVGTSDRYEIRAHGGDGALETVIRRYLSPVPVTARDRQRLVQEWRDIWYDRLDNAEIQWVLHTLEESPLPEAFPAFDPQVLDDGGRRMGESFLVDSEGNLWVAEYRPPSDDLPRWSVFDTAGVWLGEVELPPRFTLTDVGSDYLLGVSRDDLGVESVRLYDLLKPGIADAATAGS